MSPTESKTILLLFSTTIKEGCDKALLEKYFTGMVDLAKKINGYLGIEVFGEGNRTIAVAKFSSLEAVKSNSKSNSYNLSIYIFKLIFT